MKKDVNMDKLNDQIILTGYCTNPNLCEKGTVTDILTLAQELHTVEVTGTKVESLRDDKSIESIESIKSAASQPDAKIELIKNEKWYNIALQVAVPFFIAGMGTIGAGLVLVAVEGLEVFQKVDSLYILIPAIIGLKGNLDMCLASRLSTLANMGKMAGKREIIKMVMGNISLVQVQAIVAAVIVSVYATCISTFVLNNDVNIHHAMLVMCSSLLTATLSCFTLDFLLTAVIIVTHKLKLNPDNMATPLAASIGDIVSLSVLSMFAKKLYLIIETHTWVFFLIPAVYLIVMLPMWILVVRKNKYTRSILSEGWVPVLSALLISGMSGLILDKAVSKFEGFTLFQPIINGVGGNLVSVQASRISTMLHKSSLPGIFPPHTKQWVWPWTALFRGVLPAKTARILIVMSIPGQIIFVYIADLINNSGTVTVGAPFVFTYLFLTLIQIMTLLYIAHIMCHCLWRLKTDPDNSAIPILTALGDLSGSLLLLAGFTFLRALGQEYQLL